MQRLATKRVSQGRLTTDIGLVDSCGATRGIDLEVAAGDIDAAEAVDFAAQKINL